MCNTVLNYESKHYRHVSKKRSLKCVDQAILEVPEFKKSYDRYQEVYLAAGYARSTCSNYLRALTQISLYFGKSFHLLSDEEITSYLAYLQRINASYSRIKFILYGYDFLFKAMGTNRKIIYKGRSPKPKLPVVLNQSEMRKLLSCKHCKNLKHRIILCLLYSTGIRISELLRLRIADVDFEAKRIYIQQSKNGVIRYVVLSRLMAKGLQQYLSKYQPSHYLVNGYEKGKPYSGSSVRKVLSKACRSAGIIKAIYVHSLRHSFAVHFLEQGGSILQLKEQLGHKQLQSTLRYLRVVYPQKQAVRSPLDVLFNQ